MSTKLPQRGRSRAQIDAYFGDLVGMNPSAVHGSMSAYCMKGSQEMQELLQETYLKFFHHNGVTRRMMPGVVKLEDDLLAVCADILSGGHEGVVANITSGGSESIFCAMHAAREWAREKFGRRSGFEVIAPASAHPAFSKACHYLDMKLTRVPVGKDYRANAEAMRAAISKDTIALMGSAPCWPYGLFDPIERLSAIALEHGLWFHVDACVGGFLSPFLAKAGYPIPPWDFSLPGVMSISADLHKYGYAAKPSSTVAWRSAELLRFHHFSPSDWTGTPYVTQAFTGSRPIGSVAAAYAMLNFLGEEGYVRLARQAMRNKERLVEGIAKIPGLKPWQTETVLAYYESVDPALPLQKIVGGLREIGWTSFGTPEPPLVQLVVDPFPEDGSTIDQYLRDLALVVDRVRSGASKAEGGLGYVQ